MDDASNSRCRYEDNEYLQFLPSLDGYFQRQSSMTCSGELHLPQTSNPSRAGKMGMVIRPGATPVMTFRWMSMCATHSPMTWPLRPHLEQFMSRRAGLLTVPRLAGAWRFRPRPERSQFRLVPSRFASALPCPVCQDGCIVVFGLLCPTYMLDVWVGMDAGGGVAGDISRARANDSAKSKDSPKVTSCPRMLACWAGCMLRRIRA